MKYIIVWFYTRQYQEKQFSLYKKLSIRVKHFWIIGSSWQAFRIHVSNLIERPRFIEWPDDNRNSSLDIQNKYSVVRFKAKPQTSESSQEFN